MHVFGEQKRIVLRRGDDGVGQSLLFRGSDILGLGLVGSSREAVVRGLLLFVYGSGAIGGGVVNRGGSCWSRRG